MILFLLFLLLLLLLLVVVVVLFILLLLLLLLLLLIATVRNFILNKAESLEQVNSKEVKPAKKRNLQLNFH